MYKIPSYKLSFFLTSIFDIEIHLCSHYVAIANFSFGIHNLLVMVKLIISKMLILNSQYSDAYGLTFLFTYNIRFTLTTDLIDSLMPVSYTHLIFY